MRVSVRLLPCAIAITLAAVACGGTVAPTVDPSFTVSAITPNRGLTAGGTTVTITGVGFSSTAQVTFGGTAATTRTISGSSSISAVTPLHDAGAVSVIVTNGPGESVELVGGFTYAAAVFPAPKVTSASPSVGITTGGTSVRISGTDFRSGATVTFGGTAATAVTVGSATSITATTPARAAGAVDIVVTNNDSQSSTLTGGFTFATVVNPTVTAVSPSSGPVAGGTSVTLTGTNLTGVTSVTFGGTAATGGRVNSSTSITVTTPPHLSGVVSIVVTSSDGSGTLTNGYTYVAPPVPTFCSPNSGQISGGTSVSITGSNFAVGATVTFGGASASNVVVITTGQLTAITPAHAGGSYDIVVTNPDGQTGVLTGGYTYR